MSSSNHNNLLFFTMLLVSFHAPMHLGELVWPDKKALQDYHKVMKQSSVELLTEGFSFFLPGHKANRFFEGNHIVLQKNASGDDPDAPFHKYLTSHNSLYPFHPDLWLREDGSIPTHSWFIHQLHSHFPSGVASHSLRAGGATALAQASIPPHIIQAIGQRHSKYIFVNILFCLQLSCLAMTVPLDHLGMFPLSFLLNHHILPLSLSLSVSSPGKFVTLFPSKSLLHHTLSFSTL